MQGGNLKEYLKFIKRPKIKLVKKWIKQILSGLEYLHDHKYIHHDIKCENILVDRITGNIKLSYLIECEKLLENEDYFCNLRGTYEFMAPEKTE